MQIGVPRETRPHEHRVGLTPFGVSRLSELGHAVLVESGAGTGSRFTDQDYADAGARVAYQADEVLGRSDVVCKVERMTAEEAGLLAPASTLCGFMNTRAISPESATRLAERQATLLDYETLGSGGAYPALRALAEVGGQIAIHHAAELLSVEAGGRGVVLGSVPGVPPATVVVLGGGHLGWSAVRTALACGAHTIVLDDDGERLRRGLGDDGLRAAVTALATRRNLERYLPVADVVVGAVIRPGGRPRFTVGADLVARMRAGSVVVDLAITQGGCLETSRPTDLGRPTYVRDGVIHSCVPNLTSKAPRTASRALTMAVLPYLTRLAGEGLEAALRHEPGLAEACCLFRGHPVCANVALALGAECRQLEDLLGPPRSD